MQSWLKFTIQLKIKRYRQEKYHECKSIDKLSKAADKEYEAKIYKELKKGVKKYASLVI